MVAESSASEVAAISLDTARAVADFAARAYADENARTRDLDSKTFPVIALTGGAIVVVAGAMSRQPDVISPGSAAVAYFVGLIITLVLLLGAQGCFFVAIAIRPHPRIPIKSFTGPEDLVADAPMLLWQMSLTYQEAVEAHQRVSEKKVSWYQRGLTTLMGAVGVLGVVFGGVGAVAAGPWGIGIGGLIVAIGIVAGVKVFAPEVRKVWNERKAHERERRETASGTDTSQATDREAAGYRQQGESSPAASASPTD